MSNYIIGTCGHIDHGKTALIKALNGYEGDTTKEEKDRGITIDLSFSHISQNEKRYNLYCKSGCIALLIKRYLYGVI